MAPRQLIIPAAEDAMNGWSFGRSPVYGKNGVE
jgi:hypothetical protein